MPSSHHMHYRRRRSAARARAIAVPAVAIRFILAFGLLLALAALIAASVPAHSAERGVTVMPPSGGGGYGGGSWNNGGGGNWNGGGGGRGGNWNQPPVYVQPFIDVPIGGQQQQAPMPPGAPMIPADQIQALVSNAGYAQVREPQFSQGFYYVQASSAAGPVLLAVDAYSGQVVSSRPVATTPRPPTVGSGSLIGGGSLIGTPPPTQPRGPLAPDPNNPDGE